MDFSYSHRCQVSTDGGLFIPLNDSRIGLFSLKTLRTEIELNPTHCLPDLKSLGQVMAIKPCLDESKYVLVAYDGGQMSLWDIRSKKILSSLEVEQCPMSVDFNATLMHGIVGSPCDNLEVSKAHTLKSIDYFKSLICIIMFSGFFIVQG